MYRCGHYSTVARLLLTKETVQLVLLYKLLYFFATTTERQHTKNTTGKKKKSYIYRADGTRVIVEGRTRVYGSTHHGSVISFLLRLHEPVEDASTVILIHGDVAGKHVEGVLHVQLLRAGQSRPINLVLESLKGIACSSSSPSSSSSPPRHHATTTSDKR